MLKKHIYIFLLVTLTLSAQEKPNIKWGLTTQIWLRHSELNEGTTINGEPTSSYTDISIRRLRIPISSQITPKVYLYSILGGNNLNQQTKNFPLRVLDLYGEYTFDKKLEVGIGKSGWQGLNRWNVRSSKSMMGLDTPLFSINAVNKTDDLGRNLSIWFKGQHQKFDYRLVFTRPRIVVNEPSTQTDFANNRSRIKTSSYVKYQFFEEESNKSAYQTGTYINTKKILNIGAGFQYQENAMADIEQFYDIKHWAFDSFLSLPLETGEGITAYLGYYHYGFGKNYIRNLGANGSLFSDGTTFNGKGIAFPMMGTGNTLYTQLGFAFRETEILEEQVIFQPTFSIQYSNWDALQDHMIVYDIGLNAFLSDKGHKNKLTLGYQSRPIFDQTSLEYFDRKGMWVLQLQVSI